MNISKKSILAAGVFASLFFVSASGVFADGQTVKIAPPTSVNGIDIGIDDLIAFIINAIIVLGIVLSLIFLLWGGIRWILSGGDKGKVDAARSTLVAAIIGLVIVILAWVIINSVLQILGAGSLTDGFTIPRLNQEASPAAGGN